MKVPGLKLQHQPRAWQCTSTEASWCPLCGTCTCMDYEVVDQADPIRVVDPQCPLHGEAVAHGSRAGLIL